ncbi:hypothetical protein RhiirC2_850073 [Rhizophagus irregularis]|uniref:Uncharacterized protein n=1 Tax=Rhizophagus irregularis TaxID=588596 RepID=A0A2N1N8L5_9GLOM|nr:hypothetical protein RhiirC2_850073 [Rhizophagus irregularis]
MALWELNGPEGSKSFKTTDSIAVRANEPIDFIVGVENQIEYPVIAGSIRFVLGILLVLILFCIYYRYRKNRQNVNVGYEVIN